jgi:hypothetical protein
MFQKEDAKLDPEPYCMGGTQARESNDPGSGCSFIPDSIGNGHTLSLDTGHSTLRDYNKSILLLVQTPNGRTDSNLAHRSQ